MKNFKVTKKILDNYKRLKKNNSLDFDISFNDAWNIANFGMTREQYNTLVRLDRTCNFDVRSVKEVNQFISEGWQ